MCSNKFVEPPNATHTVPLGVMLPPDPAAAVMSYVLIAKSAVIERACVIAAVITPPAAGQAP